MDWRWLATAMPAPIRAGHACDKLRAIYNSISAIPRSDLFFRRKCAAVSTRVTSSVGRTIPLDQMTTPDGPIAQTENRMKMQTGFAIIALRNVARQT